MMDAMVSPSPTAANDPSSGENIGQATVVIILGVLVGLCSSLTIIAVHKFRSVSNPDILIFALAILDFTSSVTVFPLAAYWYLRVGTFPGELCLVYGALTTALQLASTAVVSLMTVDRFLAIRKPIFYRTRLGGVQLKRVVAAIVISSAVIGCIPAILSEPTTKWTIMTNRHGYCTFDYSKNFTFVILAISVPQIPLLVYCYVGFVVSIRKFIQRRQPSQEQSPVGSTASSEASGRRSQHPGPVRSESNKELVASSCRAFCCCCFGCPTKCRKKTKKVVSKEDILEKTQNLMKNLNLKRCTRMSKTVALVVIIYYVPWTLALITMVVELITQYYNSTLNLIMVRLMMAHSIFYPAVYAVLCENYKQAYKWALSLPLHACGVSWYERPPLGLTVSEMQRISHRMALEEWESPGLNRRLYSKRPFLKRSTTNSLKDAITADDEPGQTNLGFDGNENTSSEQNVDDGQVTIEIVPEGAARKPSIESTSPSTAGVQIVHIERPPSPPDERVPREENKQGTSATMRRPLENQTSDSGVDVDSIYLDSAPSGNNSPAILRLLTVDSDSSTSLSDVTEHLSQVHDVKQFNDVLKTEDQDIITATTDVVMLDEETMTDSLTENDKICDLIPTRLLENDKIVPKLIAPSTTESVTQTDNVGGVSEDTMSSGDCYSIRETTPGRKSVLRIEPCSAGDQCKGLVRIHVEVVELRPDTPPLAPDTCSLQSKTTQCRVKPASQKPSLKFCMKKNRFVPSTSSFEEMDSYSLDLGGQSVTGIDATVKVKGLSEPTTDTIVITDRKQDDELTAKHSTLSVDNNGDPPAKGFKNRQMRASRALRESTRYQDDIVMFSQMIMRRQNEESALSSSVKEEENEVESSDLLTEGQGPTLIVTDHIEL
ncbi:uncharacterized protein [Asterias amurensis]|uniref:uncharacterized protein n=1 Tax=Asterias amurensis TaxID=7602 RepID=UPI003AB7C5DE